MNNNENENIFFNCSNEFLKSMNCVCDKTKENEVKLLENLEKQTKDTDSEAFKIKSNLALSSDIQIEELKDYLYKLENEKFICIDQIEYQKTKTNLLGFKCILKITLDEILTLFSSSNNLALFLIKTLNFCTMNQKTYGLKQAFEVIKIRNNIISFYTFAFEYKNNQSSSILSLFNIKKGSCNFEKFSCSITTSIKEMNKFVSLYNNHKTKNLKDVRLNFLQNV